MLAGDRMEQGDDNVCCAQKKRQREERHKAILQTKLEPSASNSKESRKRGSVARDTQ